jgi:5-methylcytosine-specific restriction endonuclease McrA
MAKTIRYGRGVHADGRIREPEVKEALRIALASVTGGGYPRAERRLLTEQRQAILERDGGLCQSCDGPGNEIDHIGGPIDGDINHPDNLQVLCAECHRKKTMSNHRIATDPEHIARALELRERIYTPDVEHPCDDHATWKDVQRVSHRRPPQRVLRQPRKPRSRRSLDERAGPDEAWCRPPMVVGFLELTR